MNLSSILGNNILDKIEFNENSDKVFIYTVNLNNYKQNIPKFWECLSYVEKDRATKYYRKDLSDRYILSHGILRYILSHYIHQSPQDIKFTYNKYGKPLIKNNNIYFNISHSHELVSYIIALNYKVGIDIEFHDNTLNIHDLAKAVFTSTEYKFFSNLEAKLKLKFFYDLWTKKESLIKASGQGLSYPLTTIETMTLSVGGKIFLTDEDNIFKQVWYYFPLEVPPNYSGSIAIEHGINQIIYLEMSNQSNIFNIMRSKCLFSLFAAKN